MSSVVEKLESSRVRAREVIESRLGGVISDIIELSRITAFRPLVVNTCLGLAYIVLAEVNNKRRLYVQVPGGRLTDIVDYLVNTLLICGVDDVTRIVELLSGVRDEMKRKSEELSRIAEDNYKKIRELEEKLGVS